MLRHVLLAFLLLSATLAAAARPNFSGFWKLDATQSDFGPAAAPQSAEYVVRHVGSMVSFNYTQDGQTSRVDITPDNEERVTSQSDETAIWTRAYWSGDVLVLEARERRRFGTQAATGTGWTSRWSLSSDGKQLIIERKIRSGDQTADQKIVYSRTLMPKK